MARESTSTCGTYKLNDLVGNCFIRNCNFKYKLYIFSGIGLEEDNCPFLDAEFSIFKTLELERN